MSAITRQRAPYPRLGSMEADSRDNRLLRRTISDGRGMPHINQERKGTGQINRRPNSNARDSVILPPVASSSSHPKTQAPVSIEHEHRHVVVVTSQIARDARTFRHSHKTDLNELKKARNFALQIFSCLNVNELDIETCRDFKRMLGDNKLDGSITKKTEFEQLALFAEKGIRFQELSISARQSLRHLLATSLTRYLISFENEAKGLAVRSVTEYSDKIRTNLDTIDIKLDRLSGLMGEYWTRKHPFLTGYIDSATYLNRMMEDACTLLLDMCELIRKWVQDDRAYPSKLWDEIVTGNVRRNRMCDDMKRLRKKLEGVVHNLNKRVAIRDKVQKQLEDQQKEVEKLLNAKSDADNRMSQLLDHIKQKRKEMEDTERKIQFRESNSPKLLEMLFERVEEIKVELSALEEKSSAQQREVDRLHRTSTDAGISATNMEKQLKSHNDAIRNITNRIGEYENDLATMEADLQTRDAKTNVAKRIRGLKLSTATLKKLYTSAIEQIPEGMNG